MRQPGPSTFFPPQVLRNLQERQVPHSHQVRAIHGSLLRSLPGGPPQMLHSDFDPASGRDDHAECGAVLIAIDSQVSLLLLSDDEQTVVRVHLAAGDAVWFHGFVVHAGDEYTTPQNLRAHFHLVGASCERVDPYLHGLSFGPVETSHISSLSLSDCEAACASAL